MANMITEIEKTLLDEFGPLAPGKSAKSLWTDFDLTMDDIEEAIEEAYENSNNLINQVSVNLSINWLKGIEPHIPSITDVNAFVNKLRAQDLLIQDSERSEVDLISYTPSLVMLKVAELAGDWQATTTGSLIITPGRVDLVAGFDRRQITNYLPELEIVSTLLFQKPITLLIYDEAAKVLPVVYEAVTELATAEYNDDPILTNTDLIDALRDNPMISFKQVIPTNIYNVILSKFNSLKQP